MLRFHLVCNQVSLQRSILIKPIAHHKMRAYASAKGCVIVIAIDRVMLLALLNSSANHLCRYFAAAFHATSAKTFCLARRQLRFSSLSLDGSRNLLLREIDIT